MLWSEGRELFVEEAAVIKAVDDPHSSWKESFSAKYDRLVYHTSKKEIIIEVQGKPMITITSRHAD
jgi:hypothetical protein